MVVGHESLRDHGDSPAEQHASKEVPGLKALENDVECRFQQLLDVKKWESKAS